MTTIAQVRENLAYCAATIDGWRGSWYVGDKLNHGTVVVSRPPFDPRMVFGGGKATYTFRLTAYASITTPELSEILLDSLAEPTGAGSLITAIQDEANWSAVDVDWAQVTEVGAVFVAQLAEGAEQFLACPFSVEVCW